MLVLFSSYMHNSCAASDRRRLFSNLWYHIKNDSLCNRRFMDCMWCGFIDPELDIKKRHSENTDRRKRIKSISIYGHAAYLFNSVQKKFPDFYDFTWCGNTGNDRN